MELSRSQSVFYHFIFLLVYILVLYNFQTKNTKCFHFSSASHTYWFNLFTEGELCEVLVPTKCKSEGFTSSFAEFYRRLLSIPQRVEKLCHRLEISNNNAWLKFRVSKHTGIGSPIFIPMTKYYIILYLAILHSLKPVNALSVVRCSFWFEYHHQHCHRHNHHHYNLLMFVIVVTFIFFAIIAS